MVNLRLYYFYFYFFAKFFLLSFIITDKPALCTWAARLPFNREKESKTHQRMSVKQHRKQRKIRQQPVQTQSAVNTSLLPTSNHHPTPPQIIRAPPCLPR